MKALLHLLTRITYYVTLAMSISTQLQAILEEAKADIPADKLAKLTPQLEKLQENVNAFSVLADFAGK